MKGFYSLAEWETICERLSRGVGERLQIEWKDVFSIWTPYGEKEIDHLAKFKGSTTKRLEEKCPILGANFWQAGISVSGKVVRPFTTANGECYEIATDKPLTIDGADCFPVETGKVTTQRIGVGAMKGFGMALAQAGIDRLQGGDKITITATGEVASGKGSPMVTFEVEVDRP